MENPSRIRSRGATSASACKPSTHLTLLEERLHMEQFRHHGILSPTFARFATDKATPSRGSMLFEALLEIPDKPRTLMEAEIPALLYDAGMPLDTIRDHFLSRHRQERERILAYLYGREPPGSESDST